MNRQIDEHRYIVTYLEWASLDLDRNSSIDKFEKEVVR